VPWIIAIFLVIATGLFFILDGPQYVSRLKAGGQSAKPASAGPRMQPEGYFLTSMPDGRKLFTAVVSVPSESWIPVQKEFEELLKKNDGKVAAQTREQVRRYIPGRFTFFQEDRTKSSAKHFITASADGTEKNFMAEVTEFMSGPVVDRRRKVMPTWELGPGELPKPLRIQFDEDEPVTVPDKIVAPVTGEDAAFTHTKIPAIPEIQIPTVPGSR
jgi:hypothetical protein